jgi:hypothetical protein
MVLAPGRPAPARGVAKASARRAREPGRRTVRVNEAGSAGYGMESHSETFLSVADGGQPGRPGAPADGEAERFLVLHRVTKSTLDAPVRRNWPADYNG